MSYSKVLKKHIKGRYGNWLLVQLPSGNWTGVWGAVIGIEELCEAVVTGSPRFDGDSLAVNYSRRNDALQRIITGIEREIIHDGKHGHTAEVMEPFLRKARLALTSEGAK